MPIHRAATLILAGCALVVGCASDETGPSDCVSHYDTVATAPTWKELRAELLASEKHGRVDSVRTVARGPDVGAGDEEVVRVVALADRGGRTLTQVDVWRTDAGTWRAGVWMQCID